LELVESVPYKVSLRWAFYALLQEGFYSKKSDYLAWKALCARYRKQQKRGWHPTALADDTRARIYRTGGHRSVESCLDNLVGAVVDGVSFDLDHFFEQRNYVELWFEAKAMAGQFKHYTDDIDLVPFGGDPSIPFKWEIAQSLSRDERHYRKPIVVLYFGDYDPKGLEILGSAVADIAAWSHADFEVIRCGLTLEQIERFGVPENPGKPGEYQWEALSDEAAKKIILGSLAEHIDLDLISTTKSVAASKEADWRERVRNVVGELVDNER